MRCPAYGTYGVVCDQGICIDAKPFLYGGQCHSHMVKAWDFEVGRGLLSLLQGNTCAFEDEPDAVMSPAMEYSSNECSDICVSDGSVFPESRRELRHRVVFVFRSVLMEVLSGEEQRLICNVGDVLYGISFALIQFVFTAEIGLRGVDA